MINKTCSFLYFPISKFANQKCRLHTTSKYKNSEQCIWTTSYWWFQFHFMSPINVVNILHTLVSILTFWSIKECTKDTELLRRITDQINHLHVCKVHRGWILYFIRHYTLPYLLAHAYKTHWNPNHAQQRWHSLWSWTPDCIAFENNKTMKTWYMYAFFKQTISTICIIICPISTTN